MTKRETATAVGEAQERTAWRAYVGKKRLLHGDMLGYQFNPSNADRRTVKFIRVSDDGVSLLCEGKDGLNELFPVTGFYGVTVKRPAGTIDLTPTWAGVLPLLLVAFTDGTDESKKMAKEELLRMAKAADAYNASVKK